jgi:hypothetical protein
VFSLDQVRAFLSGTGSATDRRSNILTPLSWVCLPFALASLAFALRTTSTIQLIAIIFAGSFALMPVIAYIYWSLTDPNRLHTEQFQRTLRHYQYLEAQGGQKFDKPEDLKVVGPATTQEALPGGNQTPEGR